MTDFDGTTGLRILVLSGLVLAAGATVPASAAAEDSKAADEAESDESSSEPSKKAGGETNEKKEGKSYELKIASLAPEGSTWAKAIERMDRKIRKRTDGKVSLQLYPGGVMGDEPAMVRKMRTGQLDGAAVTNTGLAKIAPEVLVLQLPLLFKNWDEVDYVRQKMSEKFQSLLRDSGFTLLSWGDVGFNYIFAKKPIRKPTDLQSVKLWVWESDPIMKKIVEIGDVNAVPLTVTDVLPSLSTGVINAFSNSPYGAVSLQWYTRADYVTNLKLGVVVGGLVVRTKSLQKLPEKYRSIVHEVTDEYGREMLEQIRKDNRKAMKTIQSTGVEVVQPKSMEKWNEMAKKTRQELAGELFPATLLETIKGHLETYRDSQ
ncbi:MAG: TRAP transporter substrate-binding protein DctP [Bradymonadaceae bacterium]